MSVWLRKVLFQFLLISSTIICVMLLPTRAHEAEARNAGEAYNWEESVIVRLPGEPIPDLRTNKVVKTYGNGSCVPYARERTGIQLFGAAWTFLDQAKDAGYTTSTEPIVGSIVVLDEGPHGHVAVVEEVREDGTLKISEQNYKGLYIVSSRVIATSSVDIEGYIR